MTTPAGWPAPSAKPSRKQSLATVATPVEMRDFLERYVGPMVLKPNGNIGRKQTDPPAETQTAPAEAGAVKRSIAGAGLEPATSGL